MTAETERTWQLVMSGHGLGHITAQAQADMARLLGLVPSITHLTIETGADTIHVARDWPSDRMEEANDLLRRIAASDGITAIVVPGIGGEPPSALRMIEHRKDRKAIMTGSNEPPVSTGSEIWQLISDGIERDGDRVARSHLAADFPIYTSQPDTPAGTVIREKPDGTRELVRFKAAGEHVVGPLSAVKPRI